MCTHNVSNANMKTMTLRKQKHEPLELKNMFTLTITAYLLLNGPMLHDVLHVRSPDA